MKIRRDLWLACAERNPSRLPLATMSQPPGPPHTPQSEAASTIVPRPASSLAAAEMSVVLGKMFYTSNNLKISLVFGHNKWTNLDKII